MMKTADIPNTVNPVIQTSPLTDGPQGPDVAYPANPAGSLPVSQPNDNPDLPPLDLNDPNFRTVAKHQTVSQSTSASTTKTAVQSAPLPVNKNTFFSLTQNVAPLQSYILPEIAKGKFLTLQQNFSSDLPFTFGYPNLDAVQAIVPGFYVLGAISSLGKTTFLSQMADQIAFQGQPVMYFSREMTEFEMLSKTLSRLINLEANHNALYRRFTAIDIRKGLANGTMELNEQLDYYATHGQANMAVFKINSQANIETILDFVETFIEKTQQKPVVIIDYMQILGNSMIELPDGSVRMITDDRENVKRVVEAIKDFQTKYNVMIIGISSLNRASYTNSISFEAFKETGSIEFTADVIWGLQYSIVLEEKFQIEKKENGKMGAVPEWKKNKLLSEAKTARIRDINLSALKNRFGSAEYSIFFNYDPKYDTFTPVVMSNNTFATDEDSDGLDSLTVDDTKGETA